MNRPLHLDLLLSFLQFLNRKQLLILSEGASQRIHSLIQIEYGSKAPYFVFEMLSHNNGNFKYKINQQPELEAPPNQDEFYAFLTNCKLIRSLDTFINSDDEISLGFLKSLSHVWIGQKLFLGCAQIRPSPELYHLISTSAGKLSLAFPGAFSVLGEPFIQEHGDIALDNNMLYQPDGEFPYVNNIVEFLFASDANSRKYLHMFHTLFSYSVPIIQHRTQIADAIKQKFMSATVILKFECNFRCLMDRERGTKSVEVILNTQTNQRLLYIIKRRNYTFKTLSIGEKPEKYRSIF